jgi:DNA-binding Lrp family transcriptional regulator
MRRSRGPSEQPFGIGGWSVCAKKLKAGNEEILGQTTEQGGIVLKDVELKLVAELLKNSRRSDRELARAIGTSQPTVTRTLRRLEKEGCIKEYTMIPDFEKLGFKIMAITFIKRPRNVSSEELERLMKLGREIAETTGLKGVLALRGMGLGYDVAVISIHEDYSSFLEHLDGIKRFPHADVASLQSFLIDLTDKVQYRPFTFSYLSKYVSAMVKKERGRRK